MKISKQRADEAASMFLQAMLCAVTLGNLMPPEESDAEAFEAWQKQVAMLTTRGRASISAGLQHVINQPISLAK